MSTSRAIEKFERAEHNPRNPSPWVALYLDSSIPLNPDGKAALLLDVSSRSRQFFLPLIRPFCRLLIALLKVLKTIIPTVIHSSWILHQTIYLGLRCFVSPQANYLIVRHFNIGTEILEFVARNTKGVNVELTPLRPKNLNDLRKHVFLQHDLNVYNFIINMNRQLNEQGLKIEPIDELDFSCISDEGFDIEEMPRSWFNLIDLEAAIEMYTPMYQLLLTDSDFWRACNSLQLDETIAIYVSQLIDDNLFLGLVSNRHPLIPESTLGAAHRLMLHGLAAESLHAYLVNMKRAQAAQRAAQSSSREESHASDR